MTTPATIERTIPATAQITHEWSCPSSTRTASGSSGLSVIAPLYPFSALCQLRKLFFREWRLMPYIMAATETNVDIAFSVIHHKPLFLVAYITLRCLFVNHGNIPFDLRKATNPLQREQRLYLSS